MIDKVSHQYILELQDRLASAFHIEPRYPFFDKRLVEFCYAIPNEIKFRFGWDRYIQRVASENILPAEIQWRPLKIRFDSVLEKNLLLFEKDQHRDDSFEDNQNIGKYVNLDLIKDAYQKYKSDKDFNNLTDIWLVIILYSWLQKRDIEHK